MRNPLRLGDNMDSLTKIPQSVNVVRGKSKRSPLRGQSNESGMFPYLVLYTYNNIVYIVYGFRNQYFNKGCVMNG